MILSVSWIIVWAFAAAQRFGSELPDAESGPYNSANIGISLHVHTRTSHFFRPHNRIMALFSPAVPLSRLALYAYRGKSTAREGLFFTLHTISGCFEPRRAPSRCAVRANGVATRLSRSSEQPTFYSFSVMTHRKEAEGGDFSAKEVAQSSYNKQQNKALELPISRMPLKIGHDRRSKDALLPAQNRAPPAEEWAERVENKGTFAQKWSTFSQNTAAFWP